MTYKAEFAILAANIGVMYMNVVAYKFRVYPDAEQRNILAQTFGCVRFVYNYMLNYNKKMYKRGVPTFYEDWNKELTRLKKEFEKEWLKTPSAVPLQYALRHLERAFKNFWAGRAKYPKFKKKRNKHSAHYSSNAFYFCEETKTLRIAKMKQPLDVRYSKNFEGCPSTVILSQEPSGEYYVSMLVERKRKPPKDTNDVVGVDLGVSAMATCSDGQVFENPRALKRVEAQLRKEQRLLARRKRGNKKTPSSNRYNKKRIRVAKLNKKARDIRLDATHKMTRKLIDENQVVILEDLSVRNMVKKKKGKKNFLAKHILDVSPYEVRRQLEYKAEWAGREVIIIDRFFPSSQLCSSCGEKHQGEMTLSIRKWKCECGAVHDRDFNASVNILNEGLRMKGEALVNMALEEAIKAQKELEELELIQESLCIKDS